MERLIYFFYVVVALVCAMFFVSVWVDDHTTKLPCREVGKECRRW